jgi:hypothetical protein
MRFSPVELRRAATIAVVSLAVVGTSSLILRASYSAFTASVATGTNSWTTGTVNLGTDQTGAVVFSGLTGLKPDSALSALSPGTTGGAYAATSTASGGSACIKVSYSGGLNANIRFHATVGGADVATLGAQILFTVDTAAGAAGDPANLNCSAFPAGSTYLYGTSGTTTDVLNALPIDYLGAAATQWANVANGAVRWYRLSWLLPSTVNQTATTTKNVTATFSWEAHSL